MNKVFEKIIEKLEEMIHPKQLYFCKYARGGCKHLDNDDKDCMECIVENAIEIVKQAAEQYQSSEWGLVSKSEVLKVIEDIKCNDDIPKNYGTLLDIMRKIRNMSTVDNNGWIPCSERLPEAGKRYLVSAIWKDKDFEKSAVYDAVYGSDGLWHSYNYETVSYKVIAWQPLPEPYQPKGE